MVLYWNILHRNDYKKFAHLKTGVITALLFSILLIKLCCESFIIYYYPFHFDIWCCGVWLRNFGCSIKILLQHHSTFLLFACKQSRTGTGKTPMTEYLVRLLQSKYNTATLKPRL